jgi:PAS domain S-box-containing protein
VERAKVLVVDDMPQNLVAFEAILDDAGIEVVQAASARDALHAVLRDEFAAILLDVHMPDMDGFEAASLIRRRPLSAHTPILFLTAYGSETHTARAYSLGAVDFIQTPVNPEILRAKIGVFADLFRKRAEVKRQAERLREAEELLRHQAESALRESEGRFRVLCTSAPIAIFQLDAAGHCVYVSPLWPATTGQAPEAALGMGWTEAIGPGAAAAVIASWRAAIVEGRAWTHEQAIIRRADGERRWLYVTASPILADQGRPVGHVGIVEDVTARKQTEEQLIQADRRKDEFLAMLGHELRNPLAAIGNAVLVARTPGLENRREWSLQVIKRQVEQLSKLIDDLMDASRVRLGKIELRRDHIELTQVLSRAIDAVQPLVDERRQRIEVSLPNHPLEVIADPMRLEQVFVNLLSNASKYSHDEGPIFVTVTASTANVVVRVRDEGVGLEPGMAARIFDLFVQAQTSLDRSKGGLGIGLSLARRLTELHGGSILAKSEGLERGSEFVVTLPLATPRSSAQAIEPQLTTLEDSPPETTVLVVDDNVDAAHALELLLVAQGFRVFVAHDGGVALTRADEVQPQIVLMDLGLPVLDGYQVASALRSRPNGSALTLVAVSGYGPDHNPERAVDAGFDHHLVKPIDCAALLDLLSKSSRRRTSRKRSSAAIGD